MDIKKEIIAMKEARKGLGLKEVPGRVLPQDAAVTATILPPPDAEIPPQPRPKREKK